MNFKENSRTISSSAKISGNTLWPAFAADCLSAWIEGLSLAFSHKGSLVHDEISAEKNNNNKFDPFPTRCLKDTSWKGATDEVTYLLQFYLQLPGMNFLRVLGPVVQRLISTNPGLNCNPAFFISLFKSILGKIFTILFRTSNDQIASKNIWTEFSLKVFRPEIKFHTNPGLF